MTSRTEARARVSCDRLATWLEAHGYAGYDPFDGLSSSLRPLARTRLARQVLQQGVRRFPRNLRPLLGIEPSRATKAAAYVARAQLKLSDLEPDSDSWLAAARAQLDWLIGRAREFHDDRVFGLRLRPWNRVFMGLHERKGHSPLGRIIERD